MRLRLLAGSVLLAAVTSLLCVAPSSATGASATAGDLVFATGQCRSTRVSVTGLDSSRSWVVTAAAPNGTPLRGKGTTRVGRSTATFKATLCPRTRHGRHLVYRAGTYTIRVARATGRVGTAIGTFQVVYPTITLTAPAAPSQTFVGRLSLQGTPMGQRRITVQVKHRGRWLVQGVGTTHSDGRVYVSCESAAQCRGKLRISYQRFTFSRGFLLG